MVVATERVESRPVSKYLAVPFVIAALTGLAACAGPAIDPVESETEPQVVEAETTESPDIEELVIPENVSPQAVVLAAFIMANGDVIKAIEEGLITPEEAQLAEEALNNDSLQLWIDAAQQD